MVIRSLTWCACQTVGQFCVPSLVGEGSIGAWGGGSRAQFTVMASQAPEPCWVRYPLPSGAVVASVTLGLRGTQLIVITIVSSITVQGGRRAARTIATRLALPSCVVKLWTGAQVQISEITWKLIDNVMTLVL